MIAPQLASTEVENKYFAAVPHMADDELDPYQYRLYGHYKRVCGESEDGACWESTRTTAKNCKMSVGKVVSTRRELIEMGYIEITAGNADETHAVTLKDVMPENIRRCEEKARAKAAVHNTSTRVHHMNINVHPMNDSVHDMNQRRTKEEKPKEEENALNAHAPDVTPVPFHIANGLGRQAPTDKQPLVKSIEETAVYKAFAAGWDGIMPVLEPATADIARHAVNVLQADVDSGATTLAEIEAVTRWKVSNPKTQGYRVGFVKSDTPAYRAWKRAQNAAPKSKPAAVSVIPPAAASTNKGAPSIAKLRGH